MLYLHELGSICGQLLPPYQWHHCFGLAAATVANAPILASAAGTQKLHAAVRPDGAGPAMGRRVGLAGAKQTGSSNCHSKGAGLDLKPHLCDSVSGVSFLFDCGRGFGAKLVVPNSASNRQPEARSPRPQFAGRRVALTIRCCLDGWAWSGDPSVFGPGVP